MDSDAIIKLTRASAKGAVCDSFTVLLPPDVRRECVEQGKAGGFVDAFEIEENLRGGALGVVRPKRSKRVDTMIRELGLTGGEADALRAFRSGGGDMVVSDDRRFLQILEGLSIPFATPGAVLAALVRRGKVTPTRARAMLDALSVLVSEAEHMEAERAIKEEE